MLQVGTVIDGKYKLLRLVGDGGMGSVYEAEHIMLGSRVAVKVLHPEMAKRPGLIERFLQEARVSARLRSPHIVHVQDVDRTPEGLAFMVMELLAGEPLSRAMDRDHAFTIARAIDYTTQMLEALEVAHGMGVVHRDLKPENVFLVPESGATLVKLIDFGIAKLRRDNTQEPSNLTLAGTLMGTAEYMAPEQAYSADQVDARADLYSVGVMLFEMLAGMRPVDGEDPRVVVLKVQRGDVRKMSEVAPQVPAALAAIAHKAMTPRLEGRFPSAAEFRAAIAPFRGGALPLNPHVHGHRPPQPGGALAGPPAQGGGTAPAIGPNQIAPVQVRAPQAAHVPTAATPLMQGVPPALMQAQQHAQNAQQQNAPQAQVPARAGGTQMGEPVFQQPVAAYGPPPAGYPQPGSGPPGPMPQGAYRGPQGSVPAYNHAPHGRKQGRGTRIALTVVLGLAAGAACMYGVYAYVLPDPGSSASSSGAVTPPPQTPLTGATQQQSSSGGTVDTSTVPMNTSAPPLTPGVGPGGAGPGGGTPGGATPHPTTHPTVTPTATATASGSATNNNPFPIPIPGVTTTPSGGVVWGTSGGPSVTFQPLPWPPPPLPTH